MFLNYSNYFKKNLAIKKLLFTLHLIAGIIFSSATFSQNIVTVTDCNLNGWEKPVNVIAPGIIKFVTGPATPRLGNGSIQFNNPDNINRRLKNNQYVGTLISDITEFSFSTFVELSADIDDNISVVLQIDVNEDGVFDFPMVFNTEYQTGNYVNGIAQDQGVTQLNIWQTW